MITWAKMLVLLVGSGLIGYMVVNRGGFASFYLMVCILPILLYAALLPWLSLKSLQTQHTLSSLVCWSGEELLVSVQFSFRSVLPLPWLVWHETWMHTSSKAQLEFHKLVFPWFRRSFCIRYRMFGLQRGSYVLVKSEAITGDLFGFAVKRKSAPAAHTCMVYPIPSASLPRSTFPNSGEGHRANAVKSQQAFAAGGVREYGSGDPLQRIHWKSSARQGRLMTKETEQTASAKRMLLLDAATAAPAQAAAQPLLEQSIALAAAFFEAAASARESCGLACSSADTRRIPPAIRQDLTPAYEALASVGGRTALSFPDLVRKEAADLPPDTSMLCITSTLDLALLRALSEARSRKRHVHVVCVHDQSSLSAAQREAALQLQAIGCSFTEVPHPRSVWPGPGVIADASA